MSLSKDLAGRLLPDGFRERMAIKGCLKTAGISLSVIAREVTAALQPLDVW